MEGQHQLVKDKIQFGITKLLSFKFTREDSDHYKSLMLQCLSQAKYQIPNQPFALPREWKRTLQSWVKSDVYDLMESDDANSLDMFFDLFNERLIKTSSQYDIVMLEWMKKAFTPNNIDKQRNDFVKFFRKIIARDGRNLFNKILDILAIPNQDVLAQRNKEQVLGVVATVRTNAAELDVAVINHLVNLFSRHFIQSMLGQKPDIFLKWDTIGVSPKDASIIQLANFAAKHHPTSICFQNSCISEKAEAKGESAKRIAELERENKLLKAQLKDRDNQITQLRKLSNNGKVKVEEKAAGTKRDRPKYEGPPCTKCTDPERAKTHSSEKHKDDYVSKHEFKAQKKSDGSKKG